MTTGKQIYNARHRYKLSIRGSRTTSESKKIIQDIFFAHTKPMKLFNTFSTVLVMDTTYKTNQYKMLLFEIFCLTST
ncbi:hypothetical protein MTR_6g042630 [Medicago truncatula]|uniref:ZSWIM1/3 RNaseH-like domain-containing protein n=1 Tax=Medicago truncatula TaxID=3880 RepID=G7KIW6_MEDTR|nr:hypothetical protein MTR_6g042630 [Medicago truncatula]